MDIAVIGTGYVGLVVGTCLAESGNYVICVDIDEEKIQRLKNGEVPIYEPGLAELIERNTGEGRLQFTTDLEEAVQNSLLIFIAVGTLSNDDGFVDLSAVFEVAEGIGQAMNGYKLVINKSTVPVGTTEKVRDTIAQYTDYESDVVSNPEFLKEGKAVDDFMRPDRVIIGTDNPKVAEIMKELYVPFVRTEKPIIVMDPQSAEMTKYAANAMLATKISFMNEIANLCERIGADVEMVRKGIGVDSRIGYQFIFPGVGYGGSCFPKDVKALVNTANENGFKMRILDAVDKVNEAQKKLLFEKIYNHFQGDLADKKIAVWGLSFKPETDDMRGAPSITIINNLLEQRAEVRAHDPKANGTAQKIFEGNITYFDDYYEALQDVDALALITEWSEFRNPDFGKIKELMKAPVVFDGRNIYNSEKLRKMGFTYYGIGRP